MKKITSVIKQEMSKIQEKSKMQETSKMLGRIICQTIGRPVSGRLWSNHSMGFLSVYHM